MPAGWGSKAGWASLAGALVVAIIVALGAAHSSVHHKPWKADKVVLITIDTLRAHRLGCYGYDQRPTSPALDAWSKEAVVFDRAMAHAPWTIPSLGSLFTGRYSVEVGVYTNQGAIRPDVVTLPELFHAAGFRTATFNTHSLLVNPRTGFRRGFDEVFPPLIKPAARNQFKIPFAQTEPYLMRWLDEHSQQRFFIWIHNMDPHDPPTVGNPYLGQPNWNAYDAEVRWVDESIARIRAKLTALGIWDRSLIVFAADHGEAFGEHQVDGHRLAGHQNVMYDEVLQVPMIIQYPSMGAPRRISEPVALLDLFPTIAELAGLPVPPGIRGESLVPLINGSATQRTTDELFEARYHFEDHHHEFAVRDREWKLLVRTPDPRTGPFPLAAIEELRVPVWSLDTEGTTFELYHVADDPRETIDRFHDQLEVAEVTERLKQSLLAWKDSVQPPAAPLPAPTLNAAARESLRALGYAK